MMKTGNSVPITRSRAEACRESKENIPLGPPEKKRKLFGRDDYPKKTPTLKYNGCEALSVLSTKQPVEESVQAVSVNGPDECEETLMTTSEVEALINMKMAGKAKIDAKNGSNDGLYQEARQFLQKEAGYILEKGQLMDQIEEQRRKREDIEPQQFSKDGNEQHMQVNHLGPALLTVLLLPLLLRAGGASRIVNVNFVAHHCSVVDPHDLNLKLKRNSFNCMAAYGASKLAHMELIIAVLVNGFACKNAMMVSADDFFFRGLDKPGDTSNMLGSKVTPVNVMHLAGLNTLGISMARIDFSPYSLNPPHTHPRATKSYS